MGVKEVVFSFWLYNTKPTKRALVIHGKTYKTIVPHGGSGWERLTARVPCYEVNNSFKVEVCGHIFGGPDNVFGWGEIIKGRETCLKP